MSCFSSVALRAMLGVVVAAAIGCRSAPADEPPALSAEPVASVAAQQIIVKFKRNTLSCNAAGVAQLSAATRVALQFVRPMSGDACVIRLVSGSVAEAVTTLKQHPAVEWAEQDALMKAT